MVGAQVAAGTAGPDCPPTLAERNLTLRCGSLPLTAISGPQWINSASSVLSADQLSRGLCYASVICSYWRCYVSIEVITEGSTDSRLMSPEKSNLTVGSAIVPITCVPTLFGDSDTFERVPGG